MPSASAEQIRLRQHQDQVDAIASMIDGKQLDSLDLPPPDSDQVVMLRGALSLLIVGGFFVELACLPLRFSWLLDMYLGPSYLFVQLFYMFLTFGGLVGCWTSKQQLASRSESTTHRPPNASVSEPSILPSSSNANSNNNNNNNNNVRGNKSTNDIPSSWEAFSTHVARKCDALAGLGILHLYQLLTVLYMALWTIPLSVQVMSTVVHCVFLYFGLDNNDWAPPLPVVSPIDPLYLGIVVACHSLFAMLHLYAVRKANELGQILMSPTSRRAFDFLFASQCATCKED
jgi:hypothetical protein